MLPSSKTGAAAMTELLSPEQLRRIEGVMEPSGVPARRPVPRMAWTIDATTGRPTARWVVLTDDREAGLD
jgi:hypothetical protein